MFFRSLVIFCLALPGARLDGAIPHINARQECSFTTIIPSSDLSWCPCFLEYGPNFTCALLDVPLDYTNPAGRRAQVPFIRLAAVGQSSGVILSNPGGPGDSGVSAFLSQAAGYSLFIGSNYDYVSFDSRGIGYSIPSATCSASPSTTAQLMRRFTNQLHGPHFNVQFFSKFYQSSQALGKQCQAAIGGPDDAGPYMNSAVVAKDMTSFLEAYANSTYSQGVSNPNLLNFWGFSYGTYLGQVFANLFPNRVGRVVLDAVVDASANLAGHELQPTYADEAFSTFFVYCNLAGASNCPYYTGSTASDILDRFEATIIRLDATFAQLQGWANATTIELTLEAIKLFAYECTYYPQPLPFSNVSDITLPSFPNLALFLNDAEAAVQGLTMEKYAQLEAKYNLNASTYPPEWAVGVQCSDNGNILDGQSPLTLLPQILLNEAKSYIFGEYVSYLQIRCTGWPIIGKGRYSGPFGGATKNPILFVSNTRDPVLPIENGQKAASLYLGAQLLTIDGTGHTSPALVNYCAFAAIGTFFETGALPQGSPYGYSDNFCPLESGPWGVLATDAELNKRGLAEIKGRLKAMLRKK